MGRGSPQKPIVTDSDTLPKAPVRPRLLGGSVEKDPNSCSHEALLGDPGRDIPSSLGSSPAPRLSLGAAEGSHGVWTSLESCGVHPCGELMVSLSQAPSRGTGPDQRDPALSIGRRAWKECKHEDIFKLFPDPEIRALEARDPEVSLALCSQRKKQSWDFRDKPSSNPTHTHQDSSQD